MRIKSSFDERILCEQLISETQIGEILGDPNVDLLSHKEEVLDMMAEWFSRAQPKLS